MKNSKVIVIVSFLLLILMVGCKNNKHFKITLYPLNDDPAETIVVKNNEIITELKSFKKAGYTFSGWYYDAQFKNPVTYPFKVNSDITLYGGWYQNLIYEFDNKAKGYNVIGVNYSNKTIEIPSIVGNYPVIKISDSAFFSNNEIEEVVLPETIKEIGDSAFAFCENLKKINLPSGLEKIGVKVFNGCSNLIYQNINGLKYIDNWLVDATTVIMEHTEFLDSTIGIFPFAFYQNKHLNEIVLPSNIKKLFIGTFEDSSIKRLVINDALVDIDIYAFKNTLNLEEIITSEHNSSFSTIDGVLYDKEKTKLILYPSSKQNTEYSILPSTIIIGQRACMNNNYLKKIKMNNNVQIVESQSFYNCTNLEDIIFSTNLKTLSHEAFMLCSNLININLPEGLKEIGENTFARCNKVETLTIPFISAGDDKLPITYLFGNDNDSLLSIKNLTILGGDAITKSSLDGLFNLDSLSIGSKVKKIEESAFKDCDKLTRFTINENPYFTIINDILYTIDKKTIIWGLPFNNRQIIETNSQTEKILSDAFKGTFKTREIILNNGVKEIHANAFNSLCNLEKLVINGNVDIVEQDICINTPKVTIYVVNSISGEHWSEGWNTFNYPVIWNAIFPKINVDELERHIEIGESTSYYYEVIDAPKDCKVKITVVNEEVGIIEDNKITGIKDGIITITLEVEGYPDSICTLYIYVGNV